MKVIELKPAMQEFLDEIRAQMDAQVCVIFDMVLEELGKPGGQAAERLRFLECLESAGVDDWHGYAEALDMMNGNTDEEEDEND